MPYRKQIAAAQTDFDELTKLVANMRERGATSEAIAVTEKRRQAVYEELTRLNRLQWDEAYERVNLDDDR